MPKLCRTDDRLPALIEAQDHVLHRDQALLHGLTRRAIGHRLATRRWQLLLPDVYLCHPGEASRRQMLIGALHYAGADAAIDDVDACRFHGLTAVPPDEKRVRVVVPQASPARSRGFVVVRRTSSSFEVSRSERLRVLQPAPALIAVTRRAHSQRTVLAVLSDAVQRKIVTYDELVAAHIQGPPRNARFADEALDHVAGGVRSAPEGDFRRLAEASTVLPPLLYNPLLRLPDGHVVSPDALCVDAGLVHETNGRAAHARDDLFEDMQVRHDLMTAAGLIVLHNPPGRIHRRGREVIAQFERCFARYTGSGLPAGVVLLRLAA